MAEREEEARRIGQLVRNMRMDRGWTQKDLAMQAHLTHPYVSRIERGEVVPGHLVALRLAQAFDVTSELFTAQLSGRQYHTPPQRTPFGVMIMEARERNGWTQKHLAFLLHMGLARLRTYEQGERIPPERQTVEQFARVLDIDLEDLLSVWQPTKRKREVFQGRLNCSRCHQMKDLNEFHKDNRRYAGYHSWCKTCREEERLSGKVWQEQWPYVIADGIWKNQGARIIESPARTYKPNATDGPDPVWTEFEHLPVQWFPRGRLQPVQK